MLYIPVWRVCAGTDFGHVFFAGEDAPSLCGLAKDSSVYDHGEVKVRCPLCEARLKNVCSRDVSSSFRTSTSGASRRVPPHPNLDQLDGTYC